MDTNELMKDAAKDIAAKFENESQFSYDVKRAWIENYLKEIIAPIIRDLEKENQKLQSKIEE